jgi:hypothetical protein
MELSRRDALAVLAGSGILGGSAVAALGRRRDAGDQGGDHVLDTLVAVAQAVYPSEVENVEEFVRAYSPPRLADNETFRQGVETAVADLDENVAAFNDPETFLDLPAEARDQALRRTGAAAARPDPDGALPQRVRYYLVNDLVYALYSSPTGGELVGIENPQGHPGGTTSYRQGPRR